MFSGNPTINMKNTLSVGVISYINNSLSVSGKTTIADSLNIGNNLSVAGTSYFVGDISLVGNLNIGASYAGEPSNVNGTEGLHIYDKTYINNTLSVSQDTFINGNVNVTGNYYINGNVLNVSGGGAAAVSTTTATYSDPPLYERIDNTALTSQKTYNMNLERSNVVLRKLSSGGVTYTYRFTVNSSNRVVCDRWDNSSWSTQQTIALPAANALLLHFDVNSSGNIAMAYTGISTSSGVYVSYYNGDSTWTNPTTNLYQISATDTSSLTIIEYSGNLISFFGSNSASSVYIGVGIVNTTGTTWVATENITGISPIYAVAGNENYSIYSTASGLRAFKRAAVSSFTSVTSSLGITLTSSNSSMSISDNNILCVYRASSPIAILIYSINSVSNIATLRITLTVTTGQVPKISRDGSVLIVRDTVTGANQIYNINSTSWTLTLVQTLTRPAALSNNQWGSDTDITTDGTEFCIVGSGGNTTQEYWKRVLTGVAYNFTYDNLGSTNDGVLLNGKLRVNSNSYLQLPSGSTAQRPATNELTAFGSNTAYLRFNNTTNNLEVWINGTWKTIAVV